MQQRFLLQILLLAQYVSGTIMPIIRSSRVLYSGCCLWCFVLWFSSCWSGVELRVMCPVCRMLQHPARHCVPEDSNSLLLSSGTQCLVFRWTVTVVIEMLRSPFLKRMVFEFPDRQHLEILVVSLIGPYPFDA